jgi:hypothetical protein
VLSAITNKYLDINALQAKHCDEEKL